MYIKLSDIINDEMKKESYYAYNKVDDIFHKTSKISAMQTHQSNILFYINKQNKIIRLMKARCNFNFSFDLPQTWMYEFYLNIKMHNIDKIKVINNYLQISGGGNNEFNLIEGKVYTPNETLLMDIIK